jgi:hypothetical protein
MPLSEFEDERRYLAPSHGDPNERHEEPDEHCDDIDTLSPKPNINQSHE